MKHYQSDLEDESKPIQQESTHNSHVGTERLESLSTKGIRGHNQRSEMCQARNHTQEQHQTIEDHDGATEGREVAGVGRLAQDNCLWTKYQKH